MPDLVPRRKTNIFVFLNDTAPPEIYTLSLHDALPISSSVDGSLPESDSPGRASNGSVRALGGRSEEHTSELQSRFDLVCRLLLEKKNITGRTREGIHNSSDMSVTLPPSMQPIHWLTPI